MKSKYKVLCHYILRLLCLSVLLLLNRSELYAKDFNDVFANYKKSIVKVSTLSTRGTGFIVNKYGHIITCQDGVKNSDRVKVTLENGEMYTAKLILSDPKIDISLLKVSDIKSPVAVDLGDSNALEIGDWVMCAGYSQTEGLVVTAGIALAKGETFIQTDAAAPVGAGGGPLFDTDGKVVGVIGSEIKDKHGTRNIFAIPINLVKPILGNNEIEQ